MTHSQVTTHDLSEAPPEQAVADKEKTPRLSIRLAELLNYVPDPHKRPGIISHIVSHTGLDRHQVSALLNNKVRYIPLDTLAKLCDYLIEHRNIPSYMLPGALFAVQPESFWELLARRRRLELCVGTRRAEKTEWQEGAWVNVADSRLLGEMLTGISTLGGAAKYRTLPLMKAGEALPAPTAAQTAPHPEILKQSHAWAPRRTTGEVDVEQANKVYDSFRNMPGDKGLVCLGSMKSNPVSELIWSAAFGCEPFQSQDNVARASDRSVPFFLRYRAGDPQPPSCAGGLKLSKTEESNEPGIYYENDDQTWSLCPWSESENEVAFVFYVHREGSAFMEMTVGGYSGRATLFLSETLARHASDFWEPQINEGSLQVGAFLVQYRFKREDSENRDILRTELGAEATVIRLSTQALLRRFNVVKDDLNSAPAEEERPTRIKKPK